MRVLLAAIGKIIAAAATEVFSAHVEDSDSSSARDAVPNERANEPVAPAAELANRRNDPNLIVHVFFFAVPAGTRISNLKVAVAFSDVGRYPRTALSAVGGRPVHRSTDAAGS